jgi:hypothetical protein
MSGPLHEQARQYRFNDRFLGVLVDGFEEPDWRFRPEGGGNAAIWIVGHLAAVRRQIRRHLGENLPKVPWEDSFDMGVDPATIDSWPDPADLLADFHASGEPIEARLHAMTPEEASRELEHAFPDGGNTMEGWLRFFYFHETYHLGQLGLLRRMRGKPRFA